MKLITKYEKLQKTMLYYQRLFLGMRATLEKDLEQLEDDGGYGIESDIKILKEIRADIFLLEEKAYDIRLKAFLRIETIKKLFIK